MSIHFDLEQLVAAYEPAPGVEEAHRRAILELLRTSGNGLSRSAFDPGHVTASGFVLSPDLKRIVLVHHDRLDAWLQPGGHVEAGDADIVEAAAREITEETGLADLELVYDGVFDLDVHPIPGRGDEPPHRHFDVRFLFRARDDELGESEEVRAVRWVALDEVGDLTDDGSVLRVVAKLAVDASGRPAQPA